MENIRVLRPEEIELRVSNITEKGCLIVPYINARCAMRILDETFGNYNWQKTYKSIDGKLICSLSLYSKERDQWITKEDVGTESTYEKDKGAASDAFKRACVCWGMGRELYTSPAIYIHLTSDDLNTKGDKSYLKFNVKFFVKDIKYNNKREIVELSIVDQDGQQRFYYKKGINNSPTEKEQQQTSTNSLLQKIGTISTLSDLYEFASECGYSINAIKKAIKKHYDIENPTELTKEQYIKLATSCYENRKSANTN